jgi:hypothetical protein
MYIFSTDLTFYTNPKCVPIHPNPVLHCVCHTAIAHQQLPVSFDAFLATDGTGHVYNNTLNYSSTNAEVNRPFQTAEL